MSLLMFLYRIPDRRVRALIRRIVTILDGGFLYSRTLREIYLKYHGVQIGYGTYGGCFALGNIRPNIEIGRYCSIAPRVDFLRANHPLDDPTMHPIAHRVDFNPSLKRDRFNWTKLKIGNDVWIGQNAVVLPSCRNIGNGAVIGAGSIVTKDVPAYTVVAGNPARTIKMRFDLETRHRLEDSNWWELDQNELIERLDSLFTITGCKSDHLNP